MKRKLALSFLFVFTLALSTPVMSDAMTQDPEKKECTKKEKKECCKKEKKECDKAEKKECDKKKKECDKDKE